MFHCHAHFIFNKILFLRISNLTSTCSKPAAEDYHATVLQENQDQVPGILQQAHATAVNELNTGPPTLITKEGEGLANLKRDQLENEISNILDEIMSVLGAVYNQRAMSASDNYSKDTSGSDQADTMSDEDVSSTVSFSTPGNTITDTVTEIPSASEFRSQIHSAALGDNHISVEIQEDSDDMLQVPYNSPRSDDISDPVNDMQEEYDVQAKEQEGKPVCVRGAPEDNILQEKQGNSADDVELSKSITSQYTDSESRLNGDYTFSKANTSYEDARLSYSYTSNFESSDSSYGNISSSISGQEELEFVNSVSEARFETSLPEVQSPHSNTASTTGDVASINCNLFELHHVESENRLLPEVQSTPRDDLVDDSGKYVSAERELEESGIVHALQIQEKSEDTEKALSNYKTMLGSIVTEGPCPITSTELRDSETQASVLSGQRLADELKENILCDNVKLSATEAQPSGGKNSAYNVSKSTDGETRTSSGNNQATNFSTATLAVNSSSLAVVNCEETIDSISVHSLTEISLSSSINASQTSETSESHIPVSKVVDGNVCSVAATGEYKTETRESTVETSQEAVGLLTRQEHKTQLMAAPGVHFLHSTLTSSGDMHSIISEVSPSFRAQETVEASLSANCNVGADNTTHTMSSATAAGSKTTVGDSFRVTELAHLVTDKDSPQKETIDLESTSSEAIEQNVLDITVNNTKDDDKIPACLETSSLTLKDTEAGKECQIYQTEDRTGECFVLTEMSLETQIQTLSESTIAATQSEEFTLEEKLSHRILQPVESESTGKSNSKEPLKQSTTSQRGVVANDNGKILISSSLVSSDNEFRNIGCQSSQSDTTSKSVEEIQCPIKPAETTAGVTEYEVSEQKVFFHAIYTGTERKSVDCGDAETLNHDVLRSSGIAVSQEDTRVQSVKSNSSQEDTSQIPSVKANSHEDTSHIPSVKASSQEDTSQISTVKASSREDTLIPTVKPSQLETASLSTDFDVVEHAEVTGENEDDEASEEDDTEEDNETDYGEEDEDGDESNENSEFADTDDFGSYFETSDYQERLRHEVASAISKEIVLMAEVEVALEDLTNPKESPISPGDEASSIDAFAAYESNTFTRGPDVHKDQMTNESEEDEERQSDNRGTIELPNKHEASNTNTDYNINVNIDKSSSTFSNSQSQLEFSKDEFERKYLNTKAMSTELQLTTRSGFANQSNMLLSERKSFTTESRQEVLESGSKYILDHSSKQYELPYPVYETSILLGAVSKNPSKENADNFIENECSLTEEDTDDECVHELTHSMSFQQLSKLRLSENAEAMKSEDKTKLKRKFSRSKKRRLQRLRRKHALAESSASEFQQKSDVQVMIVDASSILQTGSEAGVNAAEDKLLQVAMAEEMRKQVDDRDSTETDISVKILPTKHKAKRKTGNKDDASHTEQHSDVLVETHKESKKGNKSKTNKVETTQLSSAGGAHAAIPQVVIEEPDEPILASETSQFERGRRRRDNSSLQFPSASNPPRNHNSPATLQVIGLEHHGGESRGSSQRSRSHSSQRSRSTHSRSRSPAPPNLRQITGQPQRRRPRKNIVVVTNPLKFP